MADLLAVRAKGKGGGGRILIRREKKNQTHNGEILKKGGKNSEKKIPNGVLRKKKGTFLSDKRGKKIRWGVGRRRRGDGEKREASGCIRKNNEKK